MSPARHSLRAAWLAGAMLLSVSCASTNVNPPQARDHKGYVDFYSPGHTNLIWEVEHAEPGTGAFKTVFSKFEPLPDGVLRLELHPGTHEFQLTFLNRVVEEPAVFLVQVQQGMVTPLKVELVPIGDISVAQKQQSFGMNIRGAGRKTRYTTQAGATERLVVSAQPPIPYRPKQQTPYPP